MKNWLVKTRTSGNVLSTLPCATLHIRRGGPDIYIRTQPTQPANKAKILTSQLRQAQTSQQKGEGAWILELHLYLYRCIADGLYLLVYIDRGQVNIFWLVNPRVISVLLWLTLETKITYTNDAEVHGSSLVQQSYIYCRSQYIKLTKILNKTKIL